MSEPNGPVVGLTRCTISHCRTVRNAPDSVSKLFEVRKQREAGNAEIVGEVIYLSAIRQSIQLIPVFGQ